MTLIDRLYAADTDSAIAHVATSDLRQAIARIEAAEKAMRLVRHKPEVVGAHCLCAGCAYRALVREQDGGER